MRLITRVGYDVSPDGKRLLMVDEMTGDEQRGTSVTVAQNWFASFKKQATFSSIPCHVARCRGSVDSKLAP